MQRPSVRKAHAYVTRGDALLVFTFADDPGARPQIPGGTVEPDETPEAAVLRELQEESGLTAVRIESLLEVFERSRNDPPANQHQRRYAFHVTLTAPAPDAWDHTVYGGGEDHGDVFCYRWLPLAEAEARLWSIQARPVPLLRRLYEDARQPEAEAL